MSADLLFDRAVTGSADILFNAGEAPSGGALTGSSCVQRNTTAAQAVAQVHVLTGRGAAQTNTSSAAGAIREQTLTGNAAAQTNTSTAQTVAQTHALAGQGAAQANIGTVAAVSQQQVLTGSEAAQTNTAAAGTVDGKAAFICVSVFVVLDAHCRQAARYALPVSDSAGIGAG